MKQDKKGNESMKTTNGIPIPDKPFLDVAVVVDNYKINAFSKRFEELGYVVEIHPFTIDTTNLKVMQVPKGKLPELKKEIQQLELNVKRSN